jgi:hypothetical protein
LPRSASCASDAPEGKAIKSFISRSRFLCLFAAAGALQLPAQAQNLPGGSYQDSCSNIQVKSDRGRSLSIYATCTDRDGRHVQSSIPLPCQSAENDNGRLKCVSGGIPPEWVPPAMPDGTFRNSCFNLSIRKDRDNNPVLIGSCTDRRGSAIQSTLWLPCQGDISNDNGSLKCEGTPSGGGAAGQGRVPPPAGSYLESCSDAVVQYQPGRRGVLFAFCVDRQGRRDQSSIYLPCAGNIANIDGRLRCEE